MYKKILGVFVLGLVVALFSVQATSAETTMETPTILNINPYGQSVDPDGIHGCINGEALTWKASPGAVYYRVYRSTSANGNYIEISNVSNGTPATSFTDTITANYNKSPVIGNTYYYKVKAFNNSNHSVMGPTDNTGPSSDFSSPVSVNFVCPTNNIEVVGYGQDLSTPTSIPAGVEVQVDGGTNKPSDPAFFNDLKMYYNPHDPQSKHLVKITVPPGYKIDSVGGCQYGAGETECNVPESSFRTSGQYTCSGNPCIATLTMALYYPDKTTVKLAVKYVPTTNALRITRYGYDAAWPSTAPAGTQAKVDNLTPNPTNPSEYTNLSAGTRNVAATDVPGYTTTFGTCTYAVGADECNIPSGTFNITPVCGGGFCYSTAVVTIGYATKVGVKYTVESSAVPAPVVTGPTSGFINTDYTFTAVSNIQTPQTAQASAALLSLASTQLKYGFDWNKDGIVDEWGPASGYVGIGVPVNSIHSWQTIGTYTFQVKAVNDQGISSTWTPFSINITDPSTSAIRVSHYGSDLSTWPSADLPSGFFAQLDSTGVTQRTDNPHDYTELTPGTHTVYVKDIHTYDTTIGTCSYISTGTECTIPGSGFSTSASCNGSLCTIPTTTTAGYITKIGVRYVSKTKCTSGQVLVNGICTDVTVACPAGGIFPNCAGDLCPAGYTMVGNTCTQSSLIPAQTCNNGLNITAYPSCTCPAGQHQTGNSCVITTCSAPYVLVNGGCQCPAGTSGVDCVPPNVPQIITFTAAPNTVNKNNPCMLKLTAQGVGSCSVTGTVNVINANVNNYISTGLTTNPITETTKFTATCKNPDETATISKNVTCFLNPSTIEQ